jgi:hypothetical protein
MLEAQFFSWPQWVLCSDEPQFLLGNGERMPVPRSLDLNFVNRQGIECVSGLACDLQSMEGREYVLLSLVLLGTSVHDESPKEICKVIFDRQIHVSVLRMKFPGNFSVSSMDALNERVTDMSIDDTVEAAIGRLDIFDRPSESQSNSSDYLVELLKSNSKSDSTRDTDRQNDHVQDLQRGNKVCLPNLCNSLPPQSTNWRGKIFL